MDSNQHKNASTHTPEPWQVGLISVKEYNDRFLCVAPALMENGDSGDVVCLVTSTKRLTENDDANAARIVACVNAMAGIEHPQQWINELKDALQKVISDKLKAIAESEQTRSNKTAQKILEDFGCGEIPNDEMVTMYYPAIISAMQEYAEQFNPSEQSDSVEWISVKDRLPESDSLGMSRDVLTLAGTKMSVKSYDFELGRWNGSPHITVTHWAELPKLPTI